MTYGFCTLGSRGTNMSSIAGTDSVFASKETGITAVQEVDPNAAEEILNVNLFLSYIEIL